MRKLLIALERWVFEERSMFLSMIKFLFLICVSVFIIISSIALVVSAVNPHDRVVLDLTTDWDCTSTHTELQRVMHGKISRLEDVTVCDNYRMRNR